MKRSAGGQPVLITRDGRSGAFLGASGEGEPGAGGLFVPEPFGFPLTLIVAQVLVEYAERGCSALVVDDESRGTGEAFFRRARMAELRGPEGLANQKSHLPISVVSRSVDPWEVAQGVHVGDLEHVGGFSVMYDKVNSEPDERAYDMGDAHDVLLVMTYPNAGSRTLHVRQHELELGPHGRIVNKV